MRKSQVEKVLARRLRINPSRVQGLIERLTDAGLVTKADGNRKNPPDLAHPEIVRMVLAVLADRGLGRVIESVAEFSALMSAEGRRFDDVLDAILAGGVDLAAVVPGSIVFRLEPASVSLTVGGTHQRFGPEPPDAAGKHVALPGRVLAAVAIELQGRSPSDADALVALASVSRSLGIARAFESALA